MMRQRGWFIPVDNLKRSVAICALLLAAPVRGQWSNPVNLSNSPPYYSVDACMDFDANGHVHVLFRDWLNSDVKIYYTENASGVWSSPQLVASTSNVLSVLRITPDQVLHAFYKANDQINEVTKPVGTVSWSSPVKVNHNGACGDPSCGDIFPAWATVDAAGGLFFAYLFLWDDNSSGPKSALWGKYKPLGGSWGAKELVQAGTDRDHWPVSSELVSYANEIYVTWEMSSQPWYKKRTAGAGGTWGSSKSMDSSGGAARLAFASDGQMALAWSKDTHIGNEWYEVFAKFSNDGGNSYFGQFNVSDNHDNLDRIPEITYDSNDDLHAIYQRFECDGCQPEVYYRVHTRSTDTWQTKINLTNTSGRTAAPFQGIRAFGTSLHFLYSDNSANGFEELFYKTTAVIPPANAGTIQGIVTDNNGLPLIGAMMITGPGNFGGSTGIGGGYTINNVPAGTYSITASKAYYLPSMSTNVVVTANQTTTRNVSITGTPPSNVTAFVVTAGNTTNHLDWTNPSSGNTSGVMIRFKTTGYPTGPTDGTLVVNHPGGAGLVDSFDHTGLTNGVTCYYTAFAYFTDASTYYASGSNATGLPAGPGDYDRDGDVDMSDFGYFQRCISGLAVFPAPGCNWADLNPSGGDNDVDGLDTNVFIGCMSGPDIPASPSCAP